MDDVLHFAFEYFDRGWPVIPVIGKSPAVAWRTYQRKRPTTGQIREWFGAGSDETYNVAVVTGAVSGLVVIDCDSAEDASWWQENFPSTPLLVRTGGGGTHFYYSYPLCEVSNRTRILRRRIDVRGDGGLVVAPPSVHPKTGNAYFWESWDHYALEEIPVFDTRWHGAPNRTTLSAQLGQSTDPKIRNGIAYIGHIHAVSGNGGHNATFRAACKLRDSGLTASEALKALISWNQTNASPKWTRKELVHKVEDAYRQLHEQAVN